MVLFGIIVRNALVEKDLGTRLTPQKNMSKVLGKVTRMEKNLTLPLQDDQTLLLHRWWLILLVFQNHRQLTKMEVYFLSKAGSICYASSQPLP
jgi:hypothetical protein